MRSLATIRPLHAAGTRRLFGLLVALWLNLAIQPCATAFEAGDHDCPHCPTVSEHAMPSHHSHGDEESTPPCASLESSCAVVDDANYDGRSGQLKLKDAPAELPVLSGTYDFEFPDPPVDERVLIADPSCRPGTSPPLNVLFCVFLD